MDRTLDSFARNLPILGLPRGLFCAILHRSAFLCAETDAHDAIWAAKNEQGDNNNEDQT